MKAAAEAAPGRERDLRDLLSAYADARGRSSPWSLCWVRGPAGIGKSHLLAAASRSLTAAGAPVFQARGGSEAWSLFAPLVKPLLAAAAEAGTGARDLADLAARLAPLSARHRVSRREQAEHAVRTEAPGGAGARLAEPSPSARAGEGPPAIQWIDLCQSFAELLTAAGRRMGLALFLDDADQADRASQELVRYLCASLCAPTADAGAGLLVVTCRDGELPAPLAEAFARAPGRHLPLSPLDLDGLRAYLSRSQAAERLLATTGGMPERIEAALSGQPAAAPELFLRRLQGFAPADRETLLALAVLGREAGEDDLRDVLLRAGLSAGLDLSARLAALEAARVIARDDEGRVDFARPHERELILDGAALSARKSLHAAAAARLIERGAPAEDVAAHQLVADPTGQGRAWALAAGDALLSRLAFDGAQDLYERALDLSGDSAGKADALSRLRELAAERGDARTALRYAGLARPHVAGEARAALDARSARLCLSLGKLVPAEALARRVLAGRALDPARPHSIDATLVLAEVIFLRGDYPAAAEFSARAIARLAGPAGAAARLALRNTLGKAHLTRGAYADARAAFEQNAAEAEVAGVPREKARALVNLGVVAHRAGDRKTAIGCYRDALALGDRSLMPFALSNIAALYHETGEIEAALDHHHRALAAFTRAGKSKEVSHAAANVARLYLYLGDARRAEELAVHAAHEAALVGDPYLAGNAALVRGEAAHAQADLPRARALLGDAAAAFERIKSPRYTVEAHLALAALELESGDTGAAQAELERAASAGAEGFSQLGARQRLLLAEVALVALEKGEPADAAAIDANLARAKDLLARETDLEGPSRLYFLLGRLKHAAGETEAGEAHFNRAARLLSELALQIPVSRREAFLGRRSRKPILDAAGAGISAPRLFAPPPPPEQRLPAMVGRSAQLSRIASLVDKVARTHATVLLRGESGTGKELVAEAIHVKSARRDMPLVKVNCGAMHEELLLSELFGHEKGSFTGAVQTRKGRFELADGGTIFLDEIGDISLKAQVALLRVLQLREFERVGGNKTMRVDVRVICATNRDLEAMMARGAFREDLYYRLKGLMITIPPLRERPEDILALAEHFLARAADERGEGPRRFAPEVADLIARYPWPGNARELENIVQSAALFAAGDAVGLEAFENHPEILGAASLPAPVAAPVPRPAPAPVPASDWFEKARASGLSLRELQHEVEVQCIKDALATAGGNVSEAARLLGMKRSRLSQIVNSEPELAKALQRKGGVQ